MNEKIPQQSLQSLEGCKPEIDYPCVWQYKVIGMERKAVQAALSEKLGDAPYSLSESRTSRQGKYISLNLELTVHNEEQRLYLYSALTADPSIKLVL
jgi:putative lipoic acid-binding regulatory protein